MGRIVAKVIAIVKFPVERKKELTLNSGFGKVAPHTEKLTKIKQ
jgi:hypothetical protein